MDVPQMRGKAVDYVALTYQDKSDEGFVNFVAVDSNGNQIDAVTRYSNNTNAVNVVLGGNGAAIDEVYMHNVEAASDEQNCDQQACDHEASITNIRACLIHEL